MNRPPSRRFLAVASHILGCVSLAFVAILAIQPDYAAWLLQANANRSRCVLLLLSLGLLLAVLTVILGHIVHADDRFKTGR